jgi:hypothetical protein
MFSPHQADSVTIGSSVKRVEVRPVGMYYDSLEAWDTERPGFGSIAYGRGVPFACQPTEMEA